MIICSCFVVSDRDIKAAVEGGARDFREIRKTLKCSTNCGACYPYAREYFDQCLRDIGVSMPDRKYAAVNDDVDL